MTKDIYYVYNPDTKLYAGVSVADPHPENSTKIKPPNENSYDYRFIGGRWEFDAELYKERRIKNLTRRCERHIEKYYPKSERDKDIDRLTALQILLGIFNISDINKKISPLIITYFKKRDKKIIDEYIDMFNYKTTTDIDSTEVKSMLREYIEIVLKIYWTFLQREELKKIKDRNYEYITLLNYVDL